MTEQEPIVGHASDPSATRWTEACEGERERDYSGVRVLLPGSGSSYLYFNACPLVPEAEPSVSNLKLYIRTLSWSRFIQAGQPTSRAVHLRMTLNRQ